MMTEATIISRGERDVGIHPCESHVTLDVEFNNDKEFREEVREILRKAFDQIHDCGKTQVLFGDEDVVD